MFDNAVTSNDMNVTTLFYYFLDKINTVERNVTSLPNLIKSKHNHLGRSLVNGRLVLYGLREFINNSCWSNTQVRFWIKSVTALFNHSLIFYTVVNHLSTDISGNKELTVEPRYITKCKGPEYVFVITGVRYIEVLFHKFYCACNFGQAGWRL